MAVERIRTAFEKTGLGRFSFLYGLGIDDAFISHNSREMNIEMALWRYLRQQNFQRIVFFSPHQSVYQIEPENAAYSPVMEPVQAIRETPSQMVYLSAGPLGDRLLYRQSPGAHHLANRGMGDMHAIRALDAYMRDATDQSTAIIWSQAESGISYFEDPRLLAGIFADWLRLPSDNRNTCIFLFSADSADRLMEIAETLPVPEIRNHILRRETGTHRAIYSVEVGTPDVSEIDALVRYAQDLYRFEIHQDDYRQITRWMAAEKIRARDWMERLSAIECLDIETTRRQGWFTAHRADSRSIQQRLDALIGLNEVKDRLFEMSAWLMVNQQKQSTPRDFTDQPLLHLVFTGNPGTGKTTIARMIGEIYHEIGILQRGHLVEAKASDLVADHVGGTAGKTNRMVDEALDGVLFIDEAYRLTEPDRGGFGAEALDTLLTRMEDDRQRLVVIVAGYPDRIERFLNANPGLSRRFPLENRFHFEDYQPDDLWQILCLMLANRSLGWSPGLEQDLKDVIAGLYDNREVNFGNAGEMRNLADALDRRRAARIVRHHLTIAAHLERVDIPPKYQEYIRRQSGAVADIRQRMTGVAGLAPLKSYLGQVLDQPLSHSPHFVDAEGVTGLGQGLNLILLGNPGTGKSYACSILGAMYQELGLLRKGHVIEVPMDYLQRGGIGKSAYRTREVVRQAKDGILLIDQAGKLFRDEPLDYTLQEVVDALVMARQNHPQDLVLVLADRQMTAVTSFEIQASLLNGIGALIVLPDYTPDDLVQILQTRLGQVRLSLDEGAVEKARRYLSVRAMEEPGVFLQARDVETMAESIIRNHGANRQPLVTPEEIPDVTYSVIVSADEAQKSTRIIRQAWVLPKAGLDGDRNDL